jgi:hypothetical protein
MKRNTKKIKIGRKGEREKVENSWKKGKGTVDFSESRPSTVVYVTQAGI